MISNLYLYFLACKISQRLVGGFSRCLAQHLGHSKKDTHRNAQVTAGSLANLYRFLFPGGVVLWWAELFFFFFSFLSFGQLLMIPPWKKCVYIYVGWLYIIYIYILPRNKKKLGVLVGRFVAQWKKTPNTWLFWRQTISPKGMRLDHPFSFLKWVNGKFRSDDVF